MGEKNLKIKNLTINVIIAIILIVILFPIIWILLCSFKSDVDIITLKFFFIPTLGNFINVLSTGRLLTGLKNSVIVTGGALIIGFAVGVPLAYIFARVNFRGRENLKFYVASVRFLPPVAVIIPFLAIWLEAGLYDTQTALIVLYLSTYQL
ncbi:MAG: hypothetical protein ABSB40_06085 [Nitrososphaeria archaeon]